MLAVSENESRQLQMVDEALKRIEDEEYGVCQNCEQGNTSKAIGGDSLGSLLSEMSGTFRTRLD